MGSISTFHMDCIKPFFGSRDKAYHVALVDYNQYVIRAITAYRGDPEVCTTTSFEFAFEDDTIVWLPYNNDLAASVPFEEYCRAHPLLFLLSSLIILLLPSCLACANNKSIQSNRVIFC